MVVVVGVLYSFTLTRKEHYLGLAQSPAIGCPGKGMVLGKATGADSEGLDNWKLLEAIFP